MLTVLFDGNIASVGSSIWIQLGVDHMLKFTLDPLSHHFEVPPRDVDPLSKLGQTGVGGDTVVVAVVWIEWGERKFILVH